MLEVKEFVGGMETVHAERLAEQHHAEFGPDRDFDVRAVSQSCYQCVADPTRSVINGWICYDAGLPVGYIIGTIHRAIYSFRNLAVQEMWYVVPEHRGGLAALMLVREFEKWAMRHNAERIYMQVEHDNDPLLVERIMRAMDRLGYKQQGYVAVKVPHYKQRDEANDRTAHRSMGAQA